MKLFDDFFGYRRLDKKWHALLMCVKSDNEDNCLFLVKVTKKHLEFCDGQQSIRIEREIEYELDPGFYLLTKDRLMVPVDEDTCEVPIKYPDLQWVFSKKDYSKTADFMLGFHPLVAMAHAMNEFCCTIELDAHRKTFEAIAKLNPDMGRIYGHENPEDAGKHGLHMEFLAGTVIFEYLVLSRDLDKSHYLTVNKEPCLFDIEKPKIPSTEEAA